MIFRGSSTTRSIPTQKSNQIQQKEAAWRQRTREKNRRRQRSSRDSSDQGKLRRDSRLQEPQNTLNCCPEMAHALHPIFCNNSDNIGASRNFTITPYFPKKERFLHTEHLEIPNITPLLSEKKSDLCPLDILKFSR